MTAKEVVNDFLAQKKIAVVGASRNKKKFGYMVFKDLKEKGYQVYPVNPNAESVDGETCFPDLNNLPEKVDGIVTVVPPAETERIVLAAAEAGITRIWMQQGSESEKAINGCKEHNIAYVSGECILMFAEPVVSVHRFHRWIWGFLGKLPK
ncbi:MAG: CoA-binding protein [Anaerolineaceae bacterium]|nr:CoA-binding protein [Anaerolineaceae bacterium]